MGGLTRLLEGKLKLKVNREKSAVARPWERKFLGFSFTNGRQPKRRIAPKQSPGSSLESESLLAELVVSASRPITVSHSPFSQICQFA